MGRPLALAIALLLAAGPAAANRLELVDLTDEFGAFWESSQGQDGPARAAAMQARLGPLLPGFYEPRGSDAARYTAHVAAALTQYPAQRDGIREVSRRFAGLLAPAQASFERQFGAFARPHRVYLVHSLGEMDGGTRALPGGVTLIFGADVIARLHLAHDIQPFFHHELFHLHHFARFTECGAVWCSLWSEGLATYVAKRLNPRATDAELLLEVPEPIPAAVEANRREAVCAVVSRLDSRERDDMRALFSFRRMNERLPPRFGYYVGYLVAADLGRSHSLRRLSALSQDQVRPLVERSLRRLATCPA